MLPCSFIHTKIIGDLLKKVNWMVDKGDALIEDGHDRNKLGGLSFLLTLEVLKGVVIIYSIIMNLLLVIFWVWLHLSDFSLWCVLRVFHFINKSCIVVVWMFIFYWVGLLLCITIYISYINWLCVWFSCDVALIPLCMLYVWWMA